MKRRKRILVLCPSPQGTNAAQRLKYEQYLGLLATDGYDFTISPFQTKRFWKIIYLEGRTLEKVFWVLVGYSRRLLDLVRVPFYNGVFVNLWVTPLGPPVFESLVRVFARKIVYDLDDMLFLDEDSSQKRILNRIKGKRKPLYFMEHADGVIVCTPSLEAIALKTNHAGLVIDISSTFNTDRFVPRIDVNRSEKITIGWTGTHSTLKYLESLKDVLAEVARLRNIKVVVICNREFELDGVEIENVSWREKTEVSDLHKIDIGLYPIPENQWSLGKSGLKALTYMAIGIPAVATAYGTIFRIIKDGHNGFLVRTKQDWVNTLVDLIDDPELRLRIGRAARKTVEDQFSVKANYAKYLNIFEKVYSDDN